MPPIPGPLGKAPSESGKEEGDQETNQMQRKEETLSGSVQPKVAGEVLEKSLIRPARYWHAPVAKTITKPRVSNRRQVQPGAHTQQRRDG